MAPVGEALLFAIAVLAVGAVTQQLARRLRVSRRRARRRRKVRQIASPLPPSSTLRARGNDDTEAIPSSPEQHPGESNGSGAAAVLPATRSVPPPVVELTPQNGSPAPSGWFRPGGSPPEPVIVRRRRGGLVGAAKRTLGISDERRRRADARPPR